MTNATTDPRLGGVLVLAADRNYALPLATTLRSIADVVPPDLRVVVLEDGFDQRTRERVTASAESLTIDYISIAGVIPPDLPTGMHFTLANYARLYIPHLVDAARVVYIDADTLVLEDPSALFFLDLGGYPFAAAVDIDSPTVSCPHALRNWRELRLDPVTRYFNSGVLLIDTDQWKRQELTDRAVRYASEHREFVRFADQDALNAVIAGQYHHLPLRWNQPTGLRRNDYRLAFAFLEGAEVDEAIKNPAIVHFVDPPKPWTGRSRRRPDPMADVWRETVQRTAWQGWSLPQRSVMRRVGSSLRRLMRGGRESGKPRRPSA